MKKLNEDLLDDILGNEKSEESIIPDINTILKTNKKIRRKSILDNIESQDIVESQQIIIPKSIAEQIEEQAVNVFIENTDKQQLIVKADQRAEIKDKSEGLTTEELEAKIAEVKEELEIIHNIDLPEQVNIVEVEEQIDTALDEIPNGEDLSLEDLDIKRIDKKDKTGYFKTKVSIKKDNIPEQINYIASYVKKQTKGLISPRVCDLRVIGNTNKTQLRTSKLKLSLATVVFKPDVTKLKVNKGTRFMISIPEDYSSTGNLLVYIQESRAKTILEVQSKDFPSTEQFSIFIADRIIEYYFSGYEITLKKLELRGVNNPLMDLINNILKTHEYKIKPYTDADSHLFSADFISKDVKNQWLVVNVIENDVPGTYDVIAKNTADQTWEFEILKGQSLGKLMNNMYNMLNQLYQKDWTIQLGLTDDDNFYYLYDKITHSKLKKAMITLNDFSTENPETGFIIQNSLSKKDLSKALTPDYDAEALIGKSNNLDYYILSYMAIKVEGGDKRNGKDYITREQYYEKYNVSDKRNYQERTKTVLAKQNSNRNYNSRIYMFQLEYSVNKEKHIYRNPSFDIVLEETGILTDSIKFPETIY